MQGYYDNLLFFLYCSCCRLYLNGIRDAGSCLNAPEVVDIYVISEFEQCFKEDKKTEE